MGEKVMLQDAIFMQLFGGKHFDAAKFSLQAMFKILAASSPYLKFLIGPLGAVITFLVTPLFAAMFLNQLIRMNDLTRKYEYGKDKKIYKDAILVLNGAKNVSESERKALIEAAMKATENVVSARKYLAK